jgi:hypothetical protein
MDIKTTTIDNETVHLKKDWLGWRVVHPLKNEDGSWNWFNVCFGSKSNLVFLVILLVLGCAFYFGVQELISNYKMVADNPCNFCSDCQEQTRGVIASINSKLTPKVINYTAYKW